jgi:hypothetical protein
VKKIIVLFVVLLCGCSGPLFRNPYLLKGYDGPVRDISEVGVIFVDVSPVYIVSINGRSFKDLRYESYPNSKWAGMEQIHFLPGVYDLELCFSYKTSYTSSSGRYAEDTHYCKDTLHRLISIEKGKIYTFKFDEGGNRWRADVVEANDLREKVLKDLSKIKEKTQDFTVQ